MGITRVALALCVAVWHLNDQLFIPVNGYTAVTCFYMISGFYMSMVLNSTYRDTPVSAFYLSRALRLFPAYWAVCVVVAAFWLLRGVNARQLFNFDQPLPVLVTSLLVNIGIFGHDALAILVTGDRPWHEINVLRLVGPAWSLAIELQFYLAAPFIVTRSLRFCVGLLLACVALRLALLGWPYDPWRYYFAPTTWCFFMLGVVAHRLYQQLGERFHLETRRRTIGLMAVAAVLGCLLISRPDLLQDLDSPKLWLFYLMFAASVPLLFGLTRRSRLDRAIGDLSYPIYLVHPIVFLALARSQGEYGHLYNLGVLWSCAGILATIAAAALIHYAVERPIDRMRRGVTRSLAQDHALPSAA